MTFFPCPSVSGNKRLQSQQAAMDGLHRCTYIQRASVEPSEERKREVVSRVTTWSCFGTKGVCIYMHINETKPWLPSRETCVQEKRGGRVPSYWAVRRHCIIVTAVAPLFPPPAAARYCCRATYVHHSTIDPGGGVNRLDTGRGTPNYFTVPPPSRWLPRYPVIRIVYPCSASIRVLEGERHPQQ